jgi:UDP-N-acetylglucosamine 2-epimerase (non-hydrolysing)
MYNVCTVVGTRPEIIKLSSVIKLLDQFTNQTLVHTGQHYDYALNDVFFEDLGIRKPNIYLDAKGHSGIDTVAQSISKFDKLLEDNDFDCVLVYGDTNSCLCTYAAKRRKIPIFHMEAGNRCFDARVPEEVNRKIIDHLADVNMVISEHARRNLLNEGLPPEYVFKVGSSMPQVLGSLKGKESSVLSTLKLSAKDYVVLSIHREENIENPTYIKELVKLLEQLVRQKTVVFSTHPKTRNLLGPYRDIIEMLLKKKRLILSEPFGFVDYIELQKKAYCTISDSGTIMEESSLLGFPAVTIRDSYERPEGMDEGVMIVSHWDCDKILEAVQICVSTERCRQVVPDYERDAVAEKVVKIVHSMIDKVKRKVYFDS